MRKPQRRHETGRPPDIAGYRSVAAMSGAGHAPAGSQRALRLMQQIYELDAALSRRQATAMSLQELCDEWQAHAAVIRHASRRGTRAWAVELLRIVAVRHGIDGRVEL